MARRTLAMTVRVADLDPIRQLVAGAEQMALYQHAGGDGWWAGWGKVRAALADLERGRRLDAADPAADPVPTADMDQARHRSTTAEAALAELHRHVRDHLDPDPGPWDDYHVTPAAKELAQNLERADRAASVAPGGTGDLDG